MRSESQLKVSCLVEKHGARNIHGHSLDFSNQTQGQVSRTMNYVNREYIDGQKHQSSKNLHDTHHLSIVHTYNIIKS